MDSAHVESSYRPAALEALKHFPVDVMALKFITHSENVTFRVSVRDSETDYVLRLHRPGYNSIEELQSERQWTIALKQAGISVPGAIATLDANQYYALIDSPGTGEQRYAGMTTWIDGQPLADILDETSHQNDPADLMYKVGELVARIHNQTTAWREPNWFRRRTLDVDALLGEAPFWGRFWDHDSLSADERKLLSGARHQLHARLSAYDTRPDNFGLIHADPNPDNIIWNGTTLSLIDFDDTAYGWHMLDVAAALIELRFDNDFDSLQAALLDGYRKNRPLAPSETDILPAFILIRAMSLMGWYHQRPEHAGDPFYEDLKTWVLGACGAL